MTPLIKHMLNHEAAIGQAFHALAEPTRRAIVERLSRGPETVSALAHPLSMSLPAVMQHLAVLEAAGLVVSTKQGRVRTCRLDTATLALAEQWFRARRLEWEARLDRLGAYLNELQQEGDPDGHQG
jgi:DNA-binding transcriptional ArsR family regulator